MIFFSKAYSKALFVLLLIITIKASVFDLCTIDGESMLPTLTATGLVLVNKAHYGIRIPLTTTYITFYKAIEAGDIVTIDSPEKNSLDNWIKRVIAVEGDSISIKSQRIYVNNQAVTCVVYAHEIDSYNCHENLNTSQIYNVKWHNHSQPHLNNNEKIRVPRNMVFVLGDNRSNSTDSRSIGLVHKTAITGRLVYIFTDISRAGKWLILFCLLLSFILAWCDSDRAVAHINNR